MARMLRTVLLVGIVATLVVLASLAARRASTDAAGAGGAAGPDLPTRTARFKRIDDGLGRPHMSALGNATIRAELGRSTWTLLHTMAARFPDEPTAEQQDDLRDFVYLLSRLYPCGQCADEFQKILRDHPPEVGAQPQRRGDTTGHR